MEIKKHKIIKLFKVVALGILVTLSILIWSLSPELQAEKQGLTMESAAVISIGLGASISMMINSKNNFNN